MEETRPPDPREMLRAVYDHPYFERVWEDRENVDRYLFVNEDGSESYSAHGLVAAHEWVVNHPFDLSFPDAAMIHRLARREAKRPNPDPAMMRPTKQSLERAEKTVKTWLFPWEVSRE